MELKAAVGAGFGAAPTGQVFDADLSRRCAMLMNSFANESGFGGWALWTSEQAAEREALRPPTLDEWLAWWDQAERARGVTPDTAGIEGVVGLYRRAVERLNAWRRERGLAAA